LSDFKIRDKCIFKNKGETKHPNSRGVDILLELAAQFSGIATRRLSIWSPRSSPWDPVPMALSKGVCDKSALKRHQTNHGLAASIPTYYFTTKLSQ